MKDMPTNTPTISELTRRTVFGEITNNWSGKLSDVDFLSRLYDLEAMPSNDGRFTSAAGDIHQHRVNNYDWDEGWVLTDTRFELMRGPDERFLQFLCETINPVVRPDLDDVNRLLGIYNEWLREDGWEIVSKKKMSGRPLFTHRRFIGATPALGAAKEMAATINAEYVQTQVARMEAAVVEDPELAIGTAKEFLETIAKTILVDSGEIVPPGIDLPRLVKQVCKKLDLLPDTIPQAAKGSDVIKRILSNLATIAQGIAEIRGLYGSGHGKHAKSNGVSPRHARLAVGASSTLAIFLFETYQERKRGG